MGQTITVAANFFNEKVALSGWLECVSQFADHILLYDCGPGGERSSDGSIELIENWDVELRHGSIDSGFGVVRTELLRMCQTDWCMILDCDERFLRYAPRLVCHGNELYPQEHYPNLVDMNLHVAVTGVYDQFAVLKSLMLPGFDAIVSSRRHWQNFAMTRPSQNWQQIADWQARILRCVDRIGYRPNIAMHEQLANFETGGTPAWYQPSIENCEIFFDHFHLAVKRCEMEQRYHDIDTYNSIHEGRKPLSFAEFKAKRDGINLEPTGDCA